MHKDVAARCGIEPGAVPGALTRGALQVDGEVEGARQVQQTHHQQEQHDRRDRELDQRLTALSATAWALNARSRHFGRHIEPDRSPGCTMCMPFNANKAVFSREISE